MILFFYMEFQDGNSYIKTRNLVKQYGKRRVVKGVNIDLRAGEIVGLLGPNGAGKTTSFYMIVGLVPATEGEVFLDGADITEVPMYKRARMGIGYLPSHLADQPAFTLSGGERRRLEITRALTARPKFLLMDEPFSGVDPISVAEVQDIIRGLKAKNIGVLITDHNVRETLSIVDRAYLIHDGTVLCEGTSEFLVNDEQSRKFYLGENFSM